MDDRVFEYDVFLLHSSKDKEIVRAWAIRVRDAGLNVWFTDWSTPQLKGLVSPLEYARTLVLFISANSVAEWASFENSMLSFRDPLNRARRFVPVRLDDTEVPESLRDCLLIDLRNSGAQSVFELLLDACKPPSQPNSKAVSAKRRLQDSPSKSRPLGEAARAVALSRNGMELLLASGTEISILAFDMTAEGQRRPGILTPVIRLSHTPDYLCWNSVEGVIVAASQRQLTEIRQVGADYVAAEIDFSKGGFTSLSVQGEYIATGQNNGVIRLWMSEGRIPSKTLRGHNSAVTALCWLTQSILSASEDRTIRLWNATTGRCIRVFEGHTGAIRCIAVTSDEGRAVSGSDDGTVRLWDLTTGMCLRVFPGHTASVKRLLWSPGDRFFVSAAADLTVRIWDGATGNCVLILDGHKTDVRELQWDLGGELLTVDRFEIKRWETRSILESAASHVPAIAPNSEESEDQVLYTNAKVLLVGESGAGKTGLSKQLALGVWELSASTVGAWATQWKLPLSNGTEQLIEREIWLWDFGGQADQRLIHQLYMDETSLVVLVFDGQKSDVFESLYQWDNDLRRASHSEFVKLLVAGRVDASPLRINSANIKSFCEERSYKNFFETSARTGQGCDELKEAVLTGIDWDRIPWRSSPRLFKLLKEEIVSLKDQGKILMRFNDLREMLVLKLHGRTERFSDAQLKAVLSLLTGPGVISELAFGGWILFQPHLINVYAQAALRTMLEDKSELGCILESDALAGNLSFHDLERVPGDDEKFILLAMHHTLLERGLCSRELTEKGHLLVFPSYYKRQRPELKGHPAVLVSYVFEGFAPEIYSTLVVRLHHTDAFKRDSLWQDAADFKSSDDLQIGLKLSKPKDGMSMIEVYADPKVSLSGKILFIRYVHEHLRQRALKVIRHRHYVCTSCGHALSDVMAAAIRVERGFEDIGCPVCDHRVALLDEIEAMYGSAKVTREVQGLEDSVAIELDNESKERVLVGEVISAVALAGQICREKNVSDHGIDAEIEFKDELHRATGQMIYLQLKSGDSYLHHLADGREIFSIKKRQHARYWMNQNCPVMLVVRASNGEMRWMEIRQYLKDAYKARRKDAKSWGRDPDDDETLPTQIEFSGSPFNTTSILKWRTGQLSPTIRSGKNKPVS